MVPLRLQTRDDCLVRGFGHGWGARENPEVVAARVADDRVAVVVGEVDDPIVAPEGTKEAHFKLCICMAIDHSSAPERRLFLAVEPIFPTAIEHIDFAIIAKRVGRRSSGAALLKALWKVGDFKPRSKVPRQVDMRHRRERRQMQSLGGTGGAPR